MTTATADCSVEVVNTNLIMVRGVSLNIRQTPKEVTKLLEHCGNHVKSIEQQYWTGNEDQTKLFIEAGIMSETRAETLVDIPIWYPRRAFHRHDGRMLVRESGFGFGLPAFLTPLSAKPIRKALRDHGIDMVVALGETEESLWMRYGQPTVVFIDFDYLGVALDHDNRDWENCHGIVGLPELAK